MELLFKFPPLTKTFSIPCNQPTLFGNKAVFFGALINNEKCLKKMNDFLTTLTISSNQSSFCDKEIEILQTITEKLELLEDEEESEVDNPREEQSSSSKGSNIKDSQRLTQEERQLLISSIEFVISGEIINEEKEQQPISELNIVKNSSIVIVRFNFRKGFDNKNKASTTLHQKTQEVPEFFQCKEHKKQACTHFCKTCAKFICAFDFVPNSKNKPEESCKNHSVITLEEYQIEIEQEIEKQKKYLEAKNQEIIDCNKQLDAESMELSSKEEKNLKSSKKISENLKEIDNIKSKSSGSIIDVDYIKLEKMITLSPKLKEIIDGLIIEKNEKLEELTKEVEARKKRMIELVEEIVNLRNGGSNQNERIKSLEKEKNELKSELTRISKDHETKNLENQKKLQEHIELQQKNEKTQKKAEYFEQIMQKFIPKLHDNVGEKINVALICNRDTADIDDVAKMLAKGNPSIEVTYKKQFGCGTAQDEIKIGPEHVIFVFQGGGHSPPWLGDVLFQHYKSGKGIVVAGNWTFAPDPKIGFSGQFSNVVPCTKGKFRITRNDGPKKLIKKEIEHPILDNVKDFDGGNGSYRAEITLERKSSEAEDVRLIGTWDDKAETPLIISKRSLKENNGNIVVLNFFPPSSEIDPADYWNSKTDGHKIMQNSVIWASKPCLRKKKIEKLISEKIPSELLEFVQQMDLFRQENGGF